MADHDDELAEAVRELTRTLEDLRQELDGSGRRRRRPRLRPPTPRDVLAFADDVAIPAALAALESSIRALEAFQRGLELVRTEREVRDRTADATTAAETRANEVRQTTLSRLDTVLSELQRASSSGALPADEDARELLADARKLRDEVDSRLRDATRGSEPAADGADASASGAVEIDIEDGTPEPTTNAETDADDDPDSDADSDANRPESNVDVDAELETLKDQYADDSEAESDGDGRDGGADETADSDSDSDSDSSSGPGDDE